MSDHETPHGGHRKMSKYEVTHMTPPAGSGVMPCCGLPPFERRNDRITNDPELVTCGVADLDAADAELAAGETVPLSDYLDALTGDSNETLA